MTLHEIPCHLEENVWHRGIAQAEGAGFMLQAVTELRSRAVSDIFIACVDGLKGFTKAIETVFPKTPYSMRAPQPELRSLEIAQSWRRNWARIVPFLNIRRGLESDLRHQCDWGAEHELAEDYQEPGVISV